MKDRGLSLPKLAVKADMDKGNLYRIVNESKGYSAESLKRLAEALGVTIGDLFMEDEPSALFLPPGTRKVPILDQVHAGVFAGVAPVFRDEEMQEFVITSNEYSEKAFAMKVNGDSMVPDFQHGDVVIVDPSASPRPGRFVVAVNSSGEASLKRFASRGTSADGAEIFELLPSNPVYPSLRSDHEPLTIVGIVRERIVKLA